jgi:hypothetical protein
MDNVGSSQPYRPPQPVTGIALLLLFTFLRADLGTARVFRRDSPPTLSRRNTGSGGERSSMLTRMERCLLALKANE